jgi:ribonuclease HII
MKYPNFNEERKFNKMGYEIVVGVDEVGRGPLAGPVVVGAVIVLENCKNSLGNKIFSPRTPLRVRKLRKNLLPRSFFLKVKDSKQLSERKREEIYKEILKCPNILWGIGQVSEKVVDKINILNATKLAMQKAVKNLQKKLSIHKTHGRGKNEYLNLFVLVDGNMKFEEGWFGDGCGCKSIVKGDQKVFSIATASIIAKVYRDNLMIKYAKKYPQYGFELHKGYGTKKHYENLKKFGQCEIHRKTFI